MRKTSSALRSKRLLQSIGRAVSVCDVLSSRFLQWPFWLTLNYTFGSSLYENNIDYELYLESPYWNRFRKEAREHYNYKCYVCGEEYKKSHLSVHVHHLHYRQFGRTTLLHENVILDVRLLCESHHLQGYQPLWMLWLMRREYRHSKNHTKTSNLWKFVCFIVGALHL